jgi:hypothetical protein
VFEQLPGIHKTLGSIPSTEKQQQQQQKRSNQKPFTFLSVCLFETGSLYVAQGSHDPPASNSQMLELQERSTILQPEAIYFYKVAERTSA